MGGSFIIGAAAKVYADDVPDPKPHDCAYSNTRSARTYILIGLLSLTGLGGGSTYKGFYIPLNVNILFPAEIGADEGINTIILPLQFIVPANPAEVVLKVGQEPSEVSILKLIGNSNTILPLEGIPAAGRDTDYIL